MGILLIIFISIGSLFSIESPDPTIEAQLDKVWNKMSVTVAAGDYDGYASVYHPDAVLVSGYSKDSYPISKALSDWKKGFDDTKAGKMKAGATFRFSQRFHDETTAHDTGMFHYFIEYPDGRRVDQYVHMNALLVKKDNQWLVVMEYQKGPGTIAEWNNLKK